MDPLTKDMVETALLSWLRTMVLRRSSIRERVNEIDEMTETNPALLTRLETGATAMPDETLLHAEFDAIYP
jgi:hypothetical protein